MTRAHLIALNLLLLLGSAACDSAAPGSGMGDDLANGEPPTTRIGVFAETNKGTYEVRMFATQSRDSWDGSAFEAADQRLGAALDSAITPLERAETGRSDDDEVRFIATLMERVERLADYQYLAPNEELRHIYVNVPDAVGSDTKLFGVWKGIALGAGTDERIVPGDMEEFPLTLDRTEAGVYRVTSPVFAQRHPACCFVSVTMPYGTRDRLYRMRLVPNEAHMEALRTLYPDG